jgi:hypothetical protein
VGASVLIAFVRGCLDQDAGLPHEAQRLGEALLPKPQLLTFQPWRCTARHTRHCGTAAGPTLTCPCANTERHQQHS